MCLLCIVCVLNLESALVSYLFHEDYTGLGESISSYTLKTSTFSVIRLVFLNFKWAALS